jgi:fibronectin-binding autotransporter adhesin
MTLGSRTTASGSGDNHQFTNIALQRDVIFDANAADRTDFENISGTGNITVTGTGRAIFMTANTFSGTLTINTNSLLGLQIGTNSGAFNGIPDATAVTIGATGVLSISFTAGGNETIGALNGSGTVRNNGGNANTLTVGAGDANGVFAGTIVNGGAGAFGFTKTGAGTQRLSGTGSSYTGVTTINGGVLEVAALANGGSNSSIGAAASNIVFGSAAAALRYIGDANVAIDRSFTLSSGATGAGGTLEASGLGAWTIPAAIALNYGTVDQPRTLTLGGTGTAANTYAGTITNNGTGVTSVVKSGTGNWALTASNSFTGPLSITGGRLNLSFIGNGGAASQVGQSPRAGANLVINGGTLAYTGISATTDRGFSTGTAGGTIEVPAATTLTFGGTSAGGNFALNGTLTKTGPGTLNLAFYSGSSAAAASDLVIDEGVVNFANGYFNGNPFGYRTLAITVNPLGVLRASASHALGGDNLEYGTSLGQIRLLGGEYNLLGAQYLGSGTVNGAGRLVLQGGSVTGTGDFRANGTTGTVITTLPSAATSVIGNSGGISLQYGALTFDVADGSAATDVSVSGPLTSPAGNSNSVTKTGAGLLALGGINTYTGSTNVNEGTLELLDNARLRFVIPATGDANKLTGAGTVVLKGDFAIDVTAAAALSSGSWVLEDAASSSYESTFTVVDPDGTLWTNAGGNRWTKPGAVEGTVWTFEAGAGTLTLGEPGEGYNSWASVNAPTGTPKDDYDGDGVANGVEYVLGGSKDTNDLSKMPKASAPGGDFVFTFDRAKASNTADTIVEIEVGTTLAGWPQTYTVGTSPEVSVTSIDANWERVTLTISRGADRAKFARLKVNID